ncbi:MAG: flagellar hook-length control protein FliK [Thermoleophilia bacterium]
MTTRRRAGAPPRAAHRPRRRPARSPGRPGQKRRAPGQTIAEVARARREAAAGRHQPAAQASQPQAPAAPGSQPGVDPTLAVLQGAPGQPTDLRLHARLHEVGAVTRLVVRMAAREEATQARITLEPGDLGQVRISLKYHAGGISAEVVADSAEAAQALQQTVGDLKRSLEAQGLVVHGLDVRLAGGDGQRPDRDPNLPTPGQGRGEAGYELDADDIRIDPGSLPLAGSQVNVLA